MVQVMQRCPCSIRSGDIPDFIGSDRQEKPVDCAQANAMTSVVAVTP